MAKRTLNERTDYPKDAFVGPYWFVRDGAGRIRLIAHRCALAEAEDYGDALTCAHGHYDLWENWRTGAAPEGMTAIVRDAQYETWPRGRVVYFHGRGRGRFIVYGDKQVFENKLQQQILDHFGIPADSVEFSTDEHYRSTRSLRMRPERHRP